MAGLLRIPLQRARICLGRVWHPRADVRLAARNPDGRGEDEVANSAEVPGVDALGGPHGRSGAARRNCRGALLNASRYRRGGWCMGAHRWDRALFGWRNSQLAGGLGRCVRRAPGGLAPSGPQRSVDGSWWPGPLFGGRPGNPRFMSHDPTATCSSPATRSPAALAAPRRSGAACDGTRRRIRLQAGCRRRVRARGVRPNGVPAAGASAELPR